MKELLKINDLKVSFDTPKGRFNAVDGVSFAVDEGKIVCVVGESGSGKSVTSLSVMRLLQTPPAHYDSGSILFEGADILKLSKKEMQKIRGEKISMIFQEPMTSLNPVLSVGWQITETIRVHNKVSRKKARERAIEILKSVGITEPERRLKEYPHQMSGGMRQRVMIAIALACEPKLLIADEPTTALDVTIQAQILKLLRNLKNEFHTSILLITHDLGVVAQMADEVVVMYGGKVMEKGSAADIFENTQHPYTIGLMECIPKMDEDVERLQTIEGVVPSLGSFPKGCHFATRCPYATEKCFEEEPKAIQVKSDDPASNGHSYYCHYQKEEWRSAHGES